MSSPHHLLQVPDDASMRRSPTGSYRKLHKLSSESIRTTHSSSDTHHWHLPSEETAVSAIKYSLEGIKQISDAVDNVPYLGPALGAAVAVLKAIEAADKNKTDLDDLGSHVRDIAGIIAAGVQRQKGELSEDLKHLLEQFERTFHRIETYIQHTHHRRWYITNVVFNSADHSKIQEFIDELQRKFQLMQARNSFTLDEIAETLKDGHSRSPSPRPASPSARLPPSPEHFRGRDKEVEIITETICSTHHMRASLCIRGAPGTGKSALALEVIHHKRVKNRFGPNRYFVPLDTVDSEVGLLRALSLSLNPGAPLEASVEKLTHEVFSMLSDGTSSLLVLDGFQDPWEARQQPVEAFLSRLSKLATVTVVLTIRGLQCPGGVDWTRTNLEPVGPLALEDAAKLFARHSGHTDSSWHKLLQEVNCVPLGIIALAKSARRLGSVPQVTREWITKPSDTRSEADNSCDISLYTSSVMRSFKSPLLNGHPNAKQITAFLSMFPDGVDREELRRFVRSPLQLDALLPVLHRMAIVEYDFSETKVIRVLPPIRPFLFQENGIKKRVLEDYMEEVHDYAEKSDAKARLLPRLTNIRAMFLEAASAPFIPEGVVIGALCSFSNFLDHYTLGGFEHVEETLERVLSRSQADAHSMTGDGQFSDWLKPLWARCYLNVGRMYRRHALSLEKTEQKGPAFRTSEDRVTEARNIAMKCNDNALEADCLWELGKIHDGQKDFRRGKQFYSEASKLKLKCRAWQDARDCLIQLANLHLSQHGRDLKEAKSTLEKALDLHTRGFCTDEPGRATCLSMLAKVYLYQNDLDTAKDLAEQSLGIRRIPMQLGYIHEVLGEISFSRNALNDAEKHFGLALTNYKKVAGGRRIEESNCQTWLNKINRKREEAKIESTKKNATNREESKSDGTKRL